MNPAFSKEAQKAAEYIPESLQIEMKGKYSFIRDEKGKPYAYKCTCGKVTRLLELELMKCDNGLKEGKCPHCVDKL